MGAEVAEHDRFVVFGSIVTDYDDAGVVGVEPVNSVHDPDSLFRLAVFADHRAVGVA